MSDALQRGILLLGQNRNDLAAEQFAKHLATEPNDAHAHGLLALCLADLERFKEATDHAAEAIRLAPDFSFTHYAMAYVLTERNHLKEALAAINEAIRLDPYDADQFALCARIHLSERRHQPALDAAEQGLQVNAENVSCQNLRAMALKNLGRHADAAGALDTALARNPENAVTHANKGWALLEKNKHDEALRHFQEALRIDPSLDWAREGIVVALKARYKIYGVMLKYFLFMGKLTRQQQWMVILGVYFGSKILGGVSKTHPAWDPYLLPIRIVIAVFAVMTWLADPLFNLALRCNRYGRLALSEDQMKSSTLIGSCLLLALLCLAGAVIADYPLHWLAVAAGLGILALPMASIYQYRVGWQRRFMGCYSAAMALALVVAVIGFTLSRAPGGNYKGPFLPVGMIAAFIFLAGALGSMWIANILAMWRVRR